MWYVIGGIVIILLVGWFLMHGAGSLLGAASGGDMEPGVDRPTSYSTDEGTVSVGANARMPENWPSDAPQNVAGSSIVYSGSSNPQTGESGSAVTYTANASVQSVVDYYKAQLASGGWTIEGTVNAGGATVISAKKATRTFGVYIVESGQGAVTVTAGVGM